MEQNIYLKVILLLASMLLLLGWPAVIIWTPTKRTCVEEVDAFAVTAHMFSLVAPILAAFATYATYNRRGAFLFPYVLGVFQNVYFYDKGSPWTTPIACGNDASMLYVILATVLASTIQGFICVVALNVFYNQTMSSVEPWLAVVAASPLYALHTVLYAIFATACVLCQIICLVLPTDPPFGRDTRGRTNYFREELCEGALPPAYPVSCNTKARFI